MDNNNTDLRQNEKTDNSAKSSGGKNTFLRIFAIVGIILILGMYILSLVASLSDWENAFGIFTGALACTIFVPIVIYLIKIFINKDN